MTKREAKIKAYERILGMIDSFVENIEADCSYKTDAESKDEMKVAQEAKEIARSLQVKYERF